MIYMHVLIFLKDGSYILFQTGLNYWISKSKVSDFSWEIKRAEEGEIEERKKRTGSKWGKIKEVEENEEEGVSKEEKEREKFRKRRRRERKRERGKRRTKIQAVEENEMENHGKKARPV